MNTVTAVRRSRTFEVVKGGVTSFAILAFIAAVSVSLWQIGGRVGLLAGLFVIVVAVAAYSLKNSE